MTVHKTGTREEWLAARLELLDAEKELTRRNDALTQQRQALPWVPIDKAYRFDTDQGSVSLAAPKFDARCVERRAGCPPYPRDSRPWGRLKSSRGPNGTMPVGLISVWVT